MSKKLGERGEVNTKWREITGLGYCMHRVCMHTVQKLPAVKVFIGKRNSRRHLEEFREERESRLDMDRALCKMRETSGR